MAKTKAVATTADLTKLSDDELIDHIKRCFRTTIESAKQTGEALAEVRRRTAPNGKWEAWVTEHFPRSIETARVYLRVFENWDRVEPEVKNGTLQTIEDVRRFLVSGKNTGKTPQTDEAIENPGEADNDADDESDKAVAGTITPAPNNDGALPPRRTVPLKYTKDEREEYERLVEELKVVLETKEQSKVVLLALRFCNERREELHA